MKSLSPILAVVLMVLVEPTEAQIDRRPQGNNSLGVFVCTVDEVFRGDELARAYEGAILTYDADKGTLDGSFLILGEPTPSRRLFSRLKVETGTWHLNNLHAVQYDPATPPNITPVIAWLMIEMLDDPETPSFKFFSSGIRTMATGGCISVPIKARK